MSVTCSFAGRLGNTLFQIATTIAHSKAVGTSIALPEYTHAQSDFNHFFDRFPKLEHGNQYYDFREPKDFSFTNIPMKDNLRLIGYWQNENYFKEHRDEVLKAFDIPYELNKGIVSIHIRRGDYVWLAKKHPPISHNYIKQALKHFKEIGYNNYLVFSDDIPWCKEYFKYWDNTGLNLSYSEGNNTLKDLSLMSGCEHNIIANSTFSWWGAWLNQNNDKIVVSPSAYNWFGNGNRNLKTEGIIPNDWKQITF